METHLFELSEGEIIEYTNGSGQLVEGNFIELREPTGKVSHVCCDIESLIQTGMVSMSKFLDDEDVQQAREEAKEEDQKIDAISVLAMMSSGGIDMRKMVLNFRELFKIVAWIGGEKQMTVPLMDRMTHKDFRRMMGEYTANFILISG